MNELDIARQIASGEAGSPQIVGEMALFAMRVTGTGIAYRKKEDEYAYRDPENYLTDEFLARCNGLPVIWEHPESGKLDSDEFKNRVVGSVFLPYIQGDEVWAVCRIYDAEAVKQMVENQLSTSPSVIESVQSEENQVELESGKMILVEGKPSILDHLAVCSVGVWDKGEAPSGVKSDSLEVNMPNEKVEVKADAEGGDLAAMEQKEDAKIDKILDLLGKLLETKTAAVADEAVVANAEAAKPEPVMADSGADEKAAELEKVRADSAALRAELAEIRSRLPKQLTDDDIAQLGKAQARADSVANAYGERAPAPMSGEGVIPYRKRLLGLFKQRCSQHGSLDVSKIDDPAVLDVIEGRVYADAQAAAATAAPEAGLREIRQTDAAGRVHTTFHGRPNDWMKQFQTPVRLVSSMSKKGN